MKITFTKEARKYILSALGMGINKEGYIIELLSGKEILTKENEKCHIDEFGGIQKDYGIIKDNLVSIIKFSDWMKINGRK
jgi:hypothetical protein